MIGPFPRQKERRARRPHQQHPHPQLPAHANVRCEECMYGDPCVVRSIPIPVAVLKLEVPPATPQDLGHHSLVLDGVERAGGVHHLSADLYINRREHKQQELRWETDDWRNKSRPTKVGRETKRRWERSDEVLQRQSRRSQSTSMTRTYTKRHKQRRHHRHRHHHHHQTSLRSHTYATTPPPSPPRLSL